MNWISSRHIHPDRNVYLAGRAPGSRWLIMSFAWVAACGAPASESETTESTSRYALDYHVSPNPGKGQVNVELTVSQSRRLLRELRFDADPARISAIAGDGEIRRDGQELVWLPEDDGGSLSWTVDVNHERNASGYDAWLDAEWGLFRAEDIIPRAATRTLRGVASDTSLRFSLPGSWSVITEYRQRDNRFRIDNKDRRFVQPSGWMIMGSLGVRRDRIAGVRVAIAAPEEQQVRRLDMLALLNWTLPELARVVPEMPDRLTIISAADPMWRGGLSGPASIYIHADRPLLSENGTSTLLHEVMHVTLGLRAEDGYDWIVEGFAEYYSLELLRRSGTLTARRHAAAMETQKTWSEAADGLCERSSTGATTAFAVGVLQTLAAELASAEDNPQTLDAVLIELINSGQPLNLQALQTAAEKVSGQIPDALHIDNLPGCRTLSAENLRP